MKGEELARSASGLGVLKERTWVATALKGGGLVVGMIAVGWAIFQTQQGVCVDEIMSVLGNII